MMGQSSKFISVVNMSFLKMFCLVPFLLGSFSSVNASGTTEIEGEAPSTDGVPIHYQNTGTREIALVFVHGWLGNTHWWDNQAKAFSDRYQVVRIDLAGHGKSGVNRNQWTAKAYAEDIRSVVNKLSLKRIVLIGHSMSGTNIVEAYQLLSDRVIAL